MSKSPGRRDHVAPVETVRDWCGDRETTLSHPAFGCATVHRITVGGSTARVFGSDLGHHSLIRVEIHEAVGVRSHSFDQHRAGPIVCSIEMSEAQWVQLIASQGIGMGVPVTFSYRRTGELLECPQIAAPRLTKTELHGKEMAQRLTQALDDMRDVAKQIAQMCNTPGVVSKTELKKLSELLSRRVAHAPDSVKFVHDMFAEATEKTVAAAKAEVEAFVVGTAQTLGLEAMRLPTPVMPSIAQAVAETEDELLERHWDDARQHYGLDDSFRYSRTEMLIYVTEYLAQAPRERT